MPNLPSTIKVRVAQYFLEFPNEIFMSGGHVLFRVACGKSVFCLQLYLTTQHICKYNKAKKKIKGEKLNLFKIL